MGIAVANKIYSFPMASAIRSWYFILTSENQWCVDMAVSETGFGWTEDRIEILKRLWTEGLSGSQIAHRLGGVTRNAVIGKVHRLGLTGRRARHSTVRRERKPRGLNLPLRPTRVFNRRRQDVAALMRPPTQVQVVREVIRRLAEQPVMEAALRVDLLDLRDSMCRFPLGDPQDESFAFCGRRKESDLVPYCGAHCRIAFAPAAPRRK